jgi:DNA-binding transcriptional LysR family regulator
LFDRLGKKVALTQAGEVLFDATHKVMASITAAEQRIEELKGLRGGYIPSHINSNNAREHRYLQ